MSNSAPLAESTTGWVATEFNQLNGERRTTYVNLTRIGTTVLCQVRERVTLPRSSTGAKATIKSAGPMQVPKIYRPVYDVFAPAWVMADGREAMGYFFIGVGGQIHFGLGADGTFDATKSNGFLPITVSWTVAA